MEEMITVVFAYINKVGAYAGTCIHDKMREIYPNEEANEFILNLNKDEKFKVIKPLLNNMASYESCTGMSNQAVLI